MHGHVLQCCVPQGEVPVAEEQGGLATPRRDDQLVHLQCQASGKAKIDRLGLRRPRPDWSRRPLVWLKTAAAGDGLKREGRGDQLAAALVLTRHGRRVSLLFFLDFRTSVG